MISVLPPLRKPHLSYFLLFLSCWLVLTSGFIHAEMTAGDLAAQLAKAQEALKNEDLVLAEEILKNLLKVEGKHAPAAHRLLGAVLLKRELPAEAIDEFTAALQIDPQDESAREYLFSIYYNRAQQFLDIPEEAYKAREALEKAIAIRPDGIMSYYFLGTLNYQEKKDAACIKTLLKVVDTLPEKLRPHLHSMLYNCAFNLLNQKRAADAVDILPYFSTPPQATINELLLTATIALEVGDFAKATELYDRILLKDPLHAVAQHNLGIAQQLLADMRRKETAATQLGEKTSGAAITTENLTKPPATSVTSAP